MRISLSGEMILLHGINLFITFSNKWIGYIWGYFVVHKNMSVYLFMLLIIKNYEKSYM